MNQDELTRMEVFSRQMRRWIVKMTTKAQSGHLTSSLSAVELLSVLFFSQNKFFRYDTTNVQHPGNDRLIFSKGHASPLFYSLWAGVGVIDEKELMTFRTFESRLEGHPTRRFPYTEVPTGSLGQGIGVAVGEALALRMQSEENRKQRTEKELHPDIQNYPLPVTRSPYVFVLLGDSELAEGSVWESVAIASHYSLDNFIAVVDVNRLGQCGETMYGWNMSAIASKFRAFGWDVVEVEDGHNREMIQDAYDEAFLSEKPCVIVAKTIKGKGVSFIENQNGWHGKALSEEDARKALGEIGVVESFTPFSLPLPQGLYEQKEVQVSGSYSPNPHPQSLALDFYDRQSTRKIYGKALLGIAQQYPELVVLDAEVSNSTYSEEFKNVHPERFFEMFIAEQNMVSTAVGMARRGFRPFVSTFGAFFSRAYDQIRMAQYADVNISFVGSHAGVSIGDDGVSQMGLEDISMFRSLSESAVLYPSDAVSMMACIRLSAEYEGISYVRTTREEAPALYKEDEKFVLGGSKELRMAKKGGAVILCAGVTVAEALVACDALNEKGIAVGVVDMYSIRPLDADRIEEMAKKVCHIVVVEDHYARGGLFSEVCRVKSLEVDTVRESSIDAPTAKIHQLAVKKRPRSGTPQELLRFEGIDAYSIEKFVESLYENI
jgi:transketolase